MKRAFILVAILAGLLAVLYFTSKKEDAKIEQIAEERRFGIKNINRVKKVVLNYAEREDVVIEKEEDRWYANDSLEIWGPTMITLLSTLRDMKVDYTPPKAVLNKVKKDIEEIGIEVLVYDESDELMTGFTIAGVTPGEDGTYAVKKGFEQPFIVGIPYQEGTIRNRFLIQEEEWRNRWIFREPLETIKKVTVDYPAFPERSFVMERHSDEDYRISRLDSELSKNNTQKVSQGTAEGYLSYFERIGIEAYENKYKKRDSLLALPPLVTITVDAKDEKWLKLYPINHEKGDVDLSKEFLSKGQLFRFIGHYSSGDLVLIQFFTIGDALRKFDDFVE